MRARALILAGLALCGFGLSTGCHHDHDEIHTHYYHHEPEPRVHVHNRFVDVRVGNHHSWHNPVRVHVNRDCD